MDKNYEGHLLTKERFDKQNEKKSTIIKNKK